MSRSYKLSLFFIPLAALLNAAPPDSLNFKNFLELKVGAVIFLRGFNHEGNDKVTSRLSETFNVNAGKKIGNLLLGISFDYTRFNLEGSPKEILADQINTYSGTKHITYTITQQTKYFNLAGGLSIAYKLDFNKWNIDLGASLYSVVYRSPLIISNRFYGPQPNYGNIAIPAEQQGLKDFNQHGKIPYGGLVMNFGYKITSGTVVKLSNTLFYDIDVNFLASPQGNLPQKNIYEIDRQYWLTSGVSLLTYF